MTRWVRFLSIFALVVSFFWVFASPGFEPALAVIVSISTLISAFAVEKRNLRRAQQHQSVSKSSVGIQASGDITLRDINGDKNAQ